MLRVASLLRSSGEATEGRTMLGAFDVFGDHIHFSLERSWILLPWLSPELVGNQCEPRVRLRECRK